jgi:hypothetical protein
LLFSTGYWFPRGGFFYTGPPTNVNIDADGAITVGGHENVLDLSQEKKVTQ